LPGGGLLRRRLLGGGLPCGRLLGGGLLRRCPLRRGLLRRRLLRDRHGHFPFFFGLSADLSVVLGVNFIDTDAAIFTGAPVCGLRPVRAARVVWLNEPKPGHATLSFFVATVTWSKNAPMVRSASALDTPADAETVSM